MWGNVQVHQFLCDAVVLSDKAGQINVGQHALCWVHAERLVHKQEIFTDPISPRPRVQSLISSYYASLKIYRAKPSPRRTVALRVQFDGIFLRRTGFAILDRLLARLHANKTELHRVLDRPEILLLTTIPRKTSAVMTRGGKSAPAHAAMTDMTAETLS